MMASASGLAMDGDVIANNVAAKTSKSSRVVALREYSMLIRLRSGITQRR
jgi:hypothetical protein